LVLAAVLGLFDLAATVPGLAAALFVGAFAAVLAGAFVGAEWTVFFAVFFFVALEDVLVVAAADASAHTASADKIGLNTNPHLTSAQLASGIAAARLLEPRCRT
jgi:hypothetical protein